MNASNPQDNTAVTQRLQALSSEIEQTLAQSRRRARIGMAMSLIAMVALGTYFYIAHDQLAKFDTRAAADVLQVQVEQAIPLAGQELTTTLKAQAPAIIDDVERKLLTVPKELIDVQLKGFLTYQMGKQFQEVEDQFYQATKSQLDIIKANYLQGRKEPLTEAETAKLLDEVMVAYGHDAGLVVDKVYQDYANQADLLITYMHKLGKNQDLTAREKIHRDLIQTFLALITKHQGDGKMDWGHIARPPQNVAVPVQN